MTVTSFCVLHIPLLNTHIKLKFSGKNVGEFGECFVFAKLKPCKFLHEMYIQNIA